RLGHQRLEGAEPRQGVVAGLPGVGRVQFDESVLDAARFKGYREFGGSAAADEKKQEQNREGFFLHDGQSSVVDWKKMRWKPSPAFSNSCQTSPNQLDTVLAGLALSSRARSASAGRAQAPASKTERSRAGAALRILIQRRTTGFRERRRVGDGVEFH